MQTKKKTGSTRFNPTAVPATKFKVAVGPPGLLHRKKDYVRSLMAATLNRRSEARDYPRSAAALNTVRAFARTTGGIRYQKLRWARS